MTVARQSTAPLPQKPLLRGWLHLVAFVVATCAGVALTLSAQPGQARAFALIYSLSLAALFGLSSLYHRPNWRPRARAWMRRLDHSGISLVIAGTVTPVSLVLPPRERAFLLVLAWAGAALGCARALLWVSAPKTLSAASYLVVGFAPMILGKAIFQGIGTVAFTWLAVGGGLYTVGAVCYALKRPKLWPAVFGYHEVFHVLVVLAATCHFVAIALVLTGSR